MEPKASWLHWIGGIISQTARTNAMKNFMGENGILWLLIYGNLLWWSWLRCGLFLDDDSLKFWLPGRMCSSCLFSLGRVGCFSERNILLVANIREAGNKTRYTIKKKHCPNTANSILHALMMLSNLIMKSL